MRPYASRLKERLFSKWIIFVLLVVLTVGSIVGSAVAGMMGFAAENVGRTTIVSSAVRASEDIFVDYNPIAVLENGHFDEVSGSFPKTALNWDSLLPFEESVNYGVSGVIDLSYPSFDANRETYKLDGIKEGQYLNPYSTSTHQENAHNVLMTNTQGKPGISGYSQSLSLEANKFYIASAWVMTSDFGANGGASISISGLPNEIAFTNINTYLTQTNSQGSHYQWKKYTIYFRTGWKAESANLNLATGYTASPTNTEHQAGDWQANGWAMFDNVVVEQVSPILYNRLRPQSVAEFGKDADYRGHKFLTDEVGSPIVLDNPIYGTQFVYEPYNYKTLTQDNIDNNFATTEKIPVSQKEYLESAMLNTDIAEWKNRRNPDGGIMQNINVALNAPIVDGSGKEIVTVNPMHPLGEFDDEGNARNITMMSSMRSGELVETSMSLTSIGGSSYTVDNQKQSSMLIKRQQYYRLSIWVKTQDVSEGIGAFVRIIGENTQFDTDADKSFKLDVLDKEITSPTDDTASANYGWVEKSYYIKGSSIRDNNIQVQIGLGDAIEGKSKGTVFFAEPSMSIITAQEYADNNANGTVVEFDASVDVGIANGTFASAGTFKQYQYPLLPENWTATSADTANTSGWDGNPVDTDKIVAGILPSDIYTNDPAHPINLAYPTHPDLPKISPIGSLTTNGGIINNGKRIDNMLLISSQNLTAYGYASTAFAVPSDAPKAITVSMAVETLGYGANLILKNDSTQGILATIENIQSTNGKIKTWTFFVEADSGNSLDSLTVEIWLGMGDSTNNTQKLSSGYILVTNVAMVEIAQALPATQAEWTFADKLEEYKGYLVDNKVDINYAMYSSATDSILAFDRYTQSNPNSALKNPYGWSISSMGGSAIVNEGNTSLYVYNGQSILTDDAPTTIIPSDFRHDSDEPFAIYASLNSPTAARITGGRSYSVDGSAYYKLTTRLNANLASLDKDGSYDYVDKDGNTIVTDGIATESIGLGIELNGTQYKFEDIRDTRKYYYKGQDDYKWSTGGYKDYTFYVATKDSTTLSLAYTLGGTDNRHKWATGQIYIAGTNIEKIDKAAYESGTSGINSDDELENRMAADLGIVTDEGSNDTTSSSNGSLNAILVPSILFSVALILAVVGVILRKISQRATVLSKPKGHTIIHTKASYDRSNAVLNSLVDTPIAQDHLQNAHNVFDDDIDDSFYTEELATIVEHKTQEQQVEHSEFDDDFESEIAQAKQEQTTEEQIAIIETLDNRSFVTKAKTVKAKTSRAKVKKYVDEFDD